MARKMMPTKLPEATNQIMAALVALPQMPHLIGKKLLSESSKKKGGGLPVKKNRRPKEV